MPENLLDELSVDTVRLDGYFVCSIKTAIVRLPVARSLENLIEKVKISFTKIPLQTHLAPLKQLAKMKFLALTLILMLAIAIMVDAGGYRGEKTMPSCKKMPNCPCSCLQKGMSWWKERR